MPVFSNSRQRGAFHDPTRNCTSQRCAAARRRIQPEIANEGFTDSGLARFATLRNPPQSLRRLADEVT
jgi:hypothetical protein